MKKRTVLIHAAVLVAGLVQVEVTDTPEGQLISVRGMGNMTLSSPGCIISPGVGGAEVSSADASTLRSYAAKGLLGRALKEMKDETLGDDVFLGTVPDAPVGQA